MPHQLTIVLFMLGILVNQLWGNYSTYHKTSPCYLSDFSYSSSPVFIQDVAYMQVKTV